MQGLCVLTLMTQTFKVVAGIEARNFPGRVAAAIPELNLFAVSEKYKRVVSELGFYDIGIVGSLALSS